MGHFKNLGNIKVSVTFTTRKTPHQISDRRNCPNFFHYNFYFFLRGEGGELPLVRTPSLTLMVVTIIQCFSNLMFNNKNLVTLKGQPLKVQFSELQYS